MTGVDRNWLRFVGTIILLLWCHGGLAQAQAPLAPSGLSVAKGTAQAVISPISFGAIGDGVTDDTQAFQKALTLCSKQGTTCVVPAGKSFLITAPLYIWGKANLVGDKLQGSIVFNAGASPYLMNIGISGPQMLEPPFSGEISGIAFKVVGGNSGRTLFFWRTVGAVITKNHFDFGPYSYSATSSGNDNNVVVNGFTNCIRKDIKITDNTVVATSNWDGSEGIGLGSFDGALIMNNKITGVGDDPIAIHFSENVKILNNDLRSVDGRLIVVNSKHVEIANNRHERIRSPKDGTFYGGISLLYIGFEDVSVANNFAAPTDMQIHHNTLYYPDGSVDAGAAIYLYALRDVTVENNQVINDSSTGIAIALHLLPLPLTVPWEDPDKIDSPKVARVHNASIIGNTSLGKYPLLIGMSGNCDEYAGTLVVKDNVAGNVSFYCNNVIASGNKSTLSPR
jgi:Right handed beta helix region